MQELAQKAALETASSILKKFYLDQAPVLSPSLSAYPVIDSLPGGKFKAEFRPHSVSFDSNGVLLLAPGDYLIPVITYCMEAGGSSPPGSIYTLSRLRGTRAELIEELNRRAVPQFSPSNVQILSWSLQAGLSYEELTSESQQILDAVVPEKKESIRESLIKKFQRDWDRFSDQTDGIFPTFEDSSEEILSGMGEVGEKIHAFMEFQSALKRYGNDYSRLSGIVNVHDRQTRSRKTTPWSMINDQVYARFVTNGHFQEIGQIQIRVLGVRKRGLSSADQLAPVDIHSWIANPVDSGIQPLSFSLVLSAGGILLVPEIASAPVIAAALLGAVLASSSVDWDSFLRLKGFLENAQDPQVLDLLHRGEVALQEAHDEIEKPLKEAGIVSKKTEKARENSDQNTRQYTKPGGAEQLEKDFDKLPGEAKTATDGMVMKELPNGETAVKRIDPKGKRPPILEIQPQKTGDKLSNRLRVKVRYDP